MTADEFSQLRRAIASDQVATTRQEIETLLREVESGGASSQAVRAGIGAYLLAQHAVAERLLSGASGDGVALYVLGMVCLSLEKWKDAENHFAAASKAGYDPVECTMKRAGAIRLQGRLEDAEAALKQAGMEGARRADYSYQMGCILADRGDTYGAIEYFERAVDMDPHHSQALFRLAGENSLYGNDVEAIRLYEQGLSKAPFYVGALLNLGLLYEDKGNYSAAAFCFRRVLQHDQTHARALMYMKDIEATSEMYYDDDLAKNEARLEQLLSRPYYVRDGHFKDVDVAIHDHIGGDFRAIHGITHVALISAKFIFHGETAHSSTAPWKGRDALDAVVLMDMGMAQYREHMQPTMRIHRVITEGGLQPNVIPARASVWWYMRDPTADGVRVLFEQAKKIAQGAALMTNTELEVEVLSAVWPVRGNQTLAEVLQSNVEHVGLPTWTPEEQEFAKKLQKAAGLEQEGLRDKIPQLKGPSPQRSPSNDCGDISWVVPMGRLTFPGNIPEVPYHNWAAGAALASSIAHKGGFVGAKALAGSIVDLFTDPSLIARAKETFKAEIGNVRYAPLLPDGQQPPADLNRGMMEQWREKMRAHYVKEKPEYV